MRRIHEDILACLREGKANAMRSDKIRKRLGLSAVDRHCGLQSAIRKLVLEGYPIGSSNDGYYIITNEDERGAAIHSLNDRISALTFRVRALQRFKL